MLPFWQFAGSLIAVTALVWLAFRFGFAGSPELRDADEARSIANEVTGGFEAEALDLDASGKGALLRDASGRIVLVAPCGAHFVARLLTSECAVEREETELFLRCAGLAARLDLGPSAVDWERAISAL